MEQDSWWGYILSLICIHAGETRNAADLAERLNWLAKVGKNST